MSAVDIVRDWADTAHDMSQFARLCAAVESGDWPVDPPHEPNPLQAEADLVMAANLDAISHRFAYVADQIEQQAPSS